MLAIGLHQEYIARIGSFFVSNSFFTTILVSLLLIGASLLLSRTLRGIFGRGVLQRAGEIIYEPIWKFVRGILENDKAAEAVFPYIATFFVFILTANFVEILPGFLGSFGIYAGDHGEELVPFLRSPSTDLNVTVALALVSVGITQIFAIRFVGFKKYISKFINLHSPLKAFLGLFEAISEISKVLSFSFRLFGNMFAGSVLLIVVGFLVPYVVPLPFMALELFVGLVQALIFSILTLMFIKAALTH